MMILKNRVGGGGYLGSNYTPSHGRAKASPSLRSEQQNGHADAVLDLTGGVAEK